MALYRSNHSHTALSKQHKATELPPRGNQSLGLYRRPSQLALNWSATRILAALYRSSHELQLSLCGLTVVVVHCFAMVWIATQCQQFIFVNCFLLPQCHNLNLKIREIKMGQNKIGASRLGGKFTLSTVHTQHYPLYANSAFTNFHHHPW